MNKLDKQYQDLLQAILDYGVEKKDRTGTGTKSIFGYTIRHNMRDGFPLLTTKKMPFKTITTELLWFLRGDTNIKYLVDNNCHIWDGDTYKNYCNNINLPPTTTLPLGTKVVPTLYSQEEFIKKIKTDDEFAKKWGELGPIYGKQWRSWETKEKIDTTINGSNYNASLYKSPTIDQIANLINDLKTNPDSRRLMVNAWNVGELDQMVLPPCHYGFQVYTRELSLEERFELFKKQNNGSHPEDIEVMDDYNIPTRAISLMWNQRSVDTFLGLPFNIASYGLLLEIIAKEVNMVPDELIGNLGDVHLYSNHVEQAREQIGRKYTPDEREEMLKESMGEESYKTALSELVPFGGGMSEYYEIYKIPRYTREPYPLPTLAINNQVLFGKGIDEMLNSCLIEGDFVVEGYQSHPSIKAPLSN